MNDQGGEKQHWMDVNKHPAWLLSPACWELMPLREDDPSATQLQSQLSFRVSLQGIKAGHCEEALRGWRREGPNPSFHLLL